jgi:hypothetical protein
MGLADEGQQVMFAKRVQLDVATMTISSLSEANSAPLTISSTLWS